MQQRNYFGRLPGMICLILLLIVLSSSTLWALREGPVGGRTGAPGESDCTVGCHNSFALNSGPGSVTISGAPAVYAFSSIYTITVTVSQTSVSTFGFEACAKKTSDNTQAGSITAGTGTQLTTQSGITYVEHAFFSGTNGTNGSKSFSFTWTSPSSDVGSIKFYAAGNAANNDQTNQGDYIYTTSSATITATPVELVAFDARIGTANSITLNWSTASETNNLGYEIQRSVDNKTFTTVGFVSGHGTTANENKYSFAITESEAGAYYYRLKQIDFDGSFEFSEVRTITIGTPAAFALNQNYPNPFNPETVIEFQLSQPVPVKLTIYDMNGRMVRTLISGSKPAGFYRVAWNGTNDLNIPVASGLYVYRIEAGAFRTAKKMLLLR